MHADSCPGANLCKSFPRQEEVSERQWSAPGCKVDAPHFVTRNDRPQCCPTAVCYAKCQNYTQQRDFRRAVTQERQTLPQLFLFSLEITTCIC